MTPEQLKASILQLAIQGKLVEQRAEEGNAEELYQQIQAEKQKLVKEGKIKKEKTLAVCSGDVDLPETWKLCRLGDCIDLLSGQDLTPDRYNNNGDGIVYLTGASNIDEDSVIVNRWTTSPTSVAYKGDLLLTCKGTIGKTCILQIEKAHIARQIMAISGIGIDMSYLRYFIEVSIDELKRKAKSMIPGVDRNTVQNLEFSLPPLEEQHRIVAKIEELFPYVDRYATSWAKLEYFNAKFPENMRKSILQYAIQGKLVEQRLEEGTAEELYQQIQAEKQKLIKEGKIKKEKPLEKIAESEIPFDIPESWKWVRLGNISYYIDAGKSPNCKKTPVSGDEWGVITTTAIQNGYFDDIQNKVLPDNYEVNKAMQVHVDDILITRAGPMNRTGVACIVKRIRYNLILSDKTLRINITPKHICRAYVVMILNSPQIRSQLIDRMSGMDKQQVNISQDKYKTVLVPLPPLEEQYRIVAKIEELLPYCDRLVKK